MYRLINKDTALNMIECAFITDKRVEHLLCKDMRAVIEVVREAIKAVPSITLKTGRWIDQDEGANCAIECSECRKEPLLDEYGEYVLSDYCPNCGCKIER